MKSKEGAYKIVNFQNVKNRINHSERNEFKNVDLVDLDSILHNANDLIPCHSKMLFEMVPTENRLFYIDEESRIIRAVKGVTNITNKRRSFEEIVVVVGVGKNSQKYFKYSEDGPDFEYVIPGPMDYLIPERINSIVYKQLQVHKLKFNKKDHDILSVFYLERGHYNHLS